MDGGGFNRLYDEGESVVLDLSTVLRTVPLPFQGRTKCDQKLNLPVFLRLMTVGFFGGRNFTGGGRTRVGRGIFFWK